MKTNIFYALLLAGLALSSCNKFLDGDDVPNKIVASEYFTNEASLKTYANGFLNSYTPDVSTLTRGDVNAEYMTKNNPGNFYLGSWDSNQQGGWNASDWNMLYNVNYFLKYMTGAKDSVSEEVYKHYAGVGRFWRAWFYYNKVKTFGAVPWYDEPIDPEDHDQLYKERDNREFVMSKILEDLKYAEENCLTGSGYVNCGQINGYIAAAFKARVCLWEGTYRKYHKVDPSTNSAWTGSYGTAEDFFKECVKSCEFIMGSGKYRINPGTKYSNLFLSPSIEYSEILWAREYSAGLNIYHNTTSIFNSSSSGGCWNMTKAFLNTYLHTDGSRHTDKPGYKTMTF